MLNRVKILGLVPGPRYALKKYYTGITDRKVQGGNPGSYTIPYNTYNNLALSRKGGDAHTYDLAMPLLEFPREIHTWECGDTISNVHRSHVCKSKTLE